MDEDAVDFVREFFNSGKPVATMPWGICPMARHH
jgi:putative intracellular protease/amidase